MTDPGRADRPLDAARVRRVLSAQFPDLAGAEPVFAGSGWDNDVYRAAGWMFRFPRRKEVADLFDRECRVQELVAARLAGGPLAVQRYKRMGTPGPDFPYPFLGYEPLAGVAADAIPAPRLDEDALAEALGRTLARLHTADPQPYQAAGVPTYDESPAVWAAGLAKRADAVASLLPDDLRDRAGGLLRGELEAPPPGPSVVAHADVCPDHLLVDPETGRPTAIIDFGDLGLADPAVDFLACHHAFSSGFLERVLAAYDAPRDAGLEARIDFCSVVGALSWVDDCARIEAARPDRPTDMPKHLRWVRNALERSRIMA